MKPRTEPAGKMDAPKRKSGRKVMNVRGVYGKRDRGRIVIVRFVGGG
jgi:hypothetical protein